MIRGTDSIADYTRNTLIVATGAGAKIPAEAGREIVEVENAVFSGDASHGLIRGGKLARLWSVPASFFAASQYQSAVPFHHLPAALPADYTEVWRDGYRHDPEAGEMLHTVWAVVHNGEIELSEKVEVPEGAKVLVTVLPDEENEFWLAAARRSLSAVWDNAEDDVYAQLLEK